MPEAPRQPLVAAGVDGCKGGWVLAGLDTCGSVVIEGHPDVAAVVRRTDGIVAIDMPIGLPEAGQRPCDAAARALLGPRRSSVFSAPIRPMLAASDYSEACAIGRRADGRGLSLQTWHLFPKIREVDALVTQLAAGRIIEVHPELCFRGLNDGIPAREAKKTAAGRLQRLDLLRTVFPDWQPDRGPAGAARDDVLDALAALWTALRHRDGKSVPVVETQDLDALGLPMQIRW